MCGKNDTVALRIASGSAVISVCVECMKPFTLSFSGNGIELVQEVKNSLVKITAWNCVICGQKESKELTITGAKGIVPFAVSVCSEKCCRLVSREVYAKGGGKMCNHCLAVLSKETARKCGQCKSTVYCGRECQKSHWPEHKKHCQLMAAQSAE